MPYATSSGVSLQSSWSQAAHLKRSVPGRMVVISIDGLRPEFYQNPHYPAPHLQRLARQGLSVNRSVPIYPTVTYSNHASILTGTPSRQHGILSNTMFSWTDGQTERWYFDYAQITAPTLWDHAKMAGLRTAALRWPTSRGAPVDDLVPEVFSLSPDSPQLDWMLTVQASTPHLIQTLLQEISREAPEGHSAYDDWFTQALIWILKKHRPDLSFLHLVQLDHVQHESGRESVEVMQALQAVDQQIAAIEASLDLSRDCLFLIGDHGFENFTQRVHLNTLFYQEGWITLKEVTTSTGSSKRLQNWKVLAQNSCGQAAVYIKDPSLKKRALEILQAHSGAIYTVLPEKELKILDAFPEAICAVDGAPGYSIGDGFEGPLVTEENRIRGEHGYLRRGTGGSEMDGGLVAVGAGIPASRKLDSIAMIDIAPTLAELMGLVIPTAQGRAFHNREDSELTPAEEMELTPEPFQSTWVQSYPELR